MTALLIHDVYINKNLQLQGAPTGLKPMKSRLNKAFAVMTALLLAAGSARFIAHYNLVEFPGAPIFSFAFIFMSSLFLSKKYEPALHVLFFSLSLVIAYKAINLKERAHSINLQEQKLNRLFVAAALLKSDRIIKGHYPKSLNKLPDSLVHDKFLTLEYCTKDCPWLVPSGPEKQSEFWLRITSKNSRDKTKTVWYINDAFEVYSGSESTQDFEFYPL